MPALIKPKKLIIVVGARPNFIKIATLMPYFAQQNIITPILVHTGQHYDIKLSKQFFTDLNIPLPDINLEVGSGSHAVQTAKIMERFEKVCINEKPDFVLVVGDVNSSLACALVAVKMGIKCVHYEAGLRSYDRSMPEEINRVMTDSISDFYFTTTDEATDNLIKENVAPEKIFMFGNLMIDTLVSQLPKAIAAPLNLHLFGKSETISIDKDFKEKKYGIVTLHRPSNVDAKEYLKNLLQTLCDVSLKIPLIFPMHFRTLKNIQDWNLLQEAESKPNLFLVEALGYYQFSHLLSKSLFVITDSGGIQEETTFLDIPCLTLRPNTERPITIQLGSNQLTTIEKLSDEVDLILKGMVKKREKIPKFWDGQTASRIVQQLQTILINK
jgi:UDP-N-acetylglucosamine 2-epimerase (non-hydrolysing)